MNIIIPPLEREMLPDDLRGKTVLDFGAKANARGTYREEYLNLYEVKDYHCCDLLEEHGAVTVDLRSETAAQTIRNKTGKKYFDFLANIGTSEHVSVQRTFYQAIHKLAKSGSYIMHWTPLAEKMLWHGVHGSLWHCQPDFHEKLAEANGYEIIKRSFPRDEISAVLYRVVQKRPFQWKKEWTDSFWKNPQYEDFDKIQAHKTEAIEL